LKVICNTFWAIILGCRLSVKWKKKHWPTDFGHWVLPPVSKSWIGLWLFFINKQVLKTCSCTYHNIPWFTLQSDVKYRSRLLLVLVYPCCCGSFTSNHWPICESTIHLC
jgi:hypothetical protein